MNKNIARFAVVGHPNKGKSSIVSTLSHDDSIEISSRSGTTSKAETFEVSSHSSYELIDTPGFQRPHKVLAWLESRATSAEQRSKAVAEFIHDSECQEKYPDEVELLTPLVEGAAILYVVDGSRPYGSEYEAEMEILRWSGQPSMALINPIENSDNIDSWKNALDQYFKMVRVFNPMDAEFEKQIELLKSFAYLNPDWTVHLEGVTEHLMLQRQQNKESATVLLASLVEDLCFHQVSQKVLFKVESKTVQPLLKKQYIDWMKQREDTAVKELLTIFKHYHTDLSINDLQLPPDLFDFEQWYVWGLDKNQLIIAATIAGAATGATIDLAVAGASLMTGAIGGALLAGTSAFFGADKLHASKLKGLPLGGYEASYGPIRNKNFPYVVIGRYLYLYEQISNRTHAQRDSLIIDSNLFQEKIAGLEKSSQKELHLVCEKLVKQKKIDFKNLSSALALLF